MHAGATFFCSITTFNTKEPSVQDAKEIKHFLDSRIPLIVIETFEEKKALEVLRRVANEQGKDLYSWAHTEGLQQLSFGPQLVPTSTKFNEPEEVLKHIRD